MSTSEEVEISSLVFESIHNRDSTKLCELLKNENVKPWKFSEFQGYTVLHRACLNNSPDIIKHILDFTRSRLSDEKFKKFVNKPNDLGFRAIHYASYSGNIEIIKLLVENSADFEIETKKGLSVLHLAAQADQVEPIIYFVEKFGLNLQIADKYGSTVLHWACYLGSENVINFLLTRYLKCVNVNIKDKDGLTPLHLAVFSEKSKIIKKLIYVGADVKIKDQKGRNAYDLAVEKKKENVKRLLTNNCSILSKSNYFLAILLIFLNFSVNCTIVSFILPSLEIITLEYLYITMFALILTFQMYLCTSNPDFIKNDQNLNFLNLLENNEKASLYCPICIIKKTDSIKHCYYCKKCFQNYDHHCHWVNNCISDANIVFFLIFLFMISINLLSNCIVCIISKYIKFNFRFYQNENKSNTFDSQ